MRSETDDDEEEKSTVEKTSTKMKEMIIHTIRKSAEEKWVFWYLI